MHRPESFINRVIWMLLLCVLCGCAGLHTRSSMPAHSTVIMVSIDGMPAALLGVGAMPTLDAMAVDGTHAQALVPSYPTLTFPNHYTLVTGLRPDHHGIVHNRMRDAQLGEFVSKNDSARVGAWWGGEPIWNTLQRQGGSAAVMFWPGSMASINGGKAREVRDFEAGLPVDARIDQVLQWLQLPSSQRPQLILLYFDQYDIAAHAHGTRSPQALAALREIDDALRRLRDSLPASMTNMLDWLVVSDHGMTDMLQAQRIDLDDVVDVDALSVRNTGQNVGVDAKPGRAVEVERALLGRHAHFECWRKTALPDAWHYGTHPRIPSIVCQADPGWQVLTRASPPETRAISGQHGYAPELPDMHGIFVGYGPRFRSGTVLPAFDNVDVYPLLARLLHIQPAPNDGDVRVFDPALTPEH